MRVAASVIGVGVMFINGHNVLYPVGTRAGAKVAEDVVLPAGPPLPQPPVAASPPAPAATVSPTPPAIPSTTPAKEPAQ
jgi:hypothetical protein